MLAVYTWHSYSRLRPRKSLDSESQQKSLVIPPTANSACCGLGAAFPCAVVKTNLCKMLAKPDAHQSSGPPAPYQRHRNKRRASLWNALRIIHLQLYWGSSLSLGDGKSICLKPNQPTFLWACFSFPKGNIFWRNETKGKQIDWFNTSCICESLLSTIQVLQGHKKTRTWPLTLWSLHSTWEHTELHEYL